MILSIKNISKTYNNGKLNVLSDINLQVNKGEYICLMGQSGSGKSTLMHIMGGLDKPDSGEVIFNGQSLNLLTDRQMSMIRRRQMGFIFQFFNLLPTMTALENVMLPALIDGASFVSAQKRAYELLDLMEMKDRAAHRPSELSGGQMQRVAIARSLFAEPQLILADEPTGNLDSKTGESVLKLLKKINQEFNQTLIMVTHDSKAASYASRIIRLSDGKIVGDTLQGVENSSEKKLN